MTYIALYLVGIASIWWVSRVGWSEALKTSVNVLIPSALILLINIKAGRLLFKSPIVGTISVIPTAVFIFKATQPLLVRINNWIDKKTNGHVDMKNVVDAEVISKEDA